MSTTKEKYLRVAINRDRLEDIDMLFDMTADWLQGFDGDQPEAFAALRHLHNHFFPDRMAFCEDCGGCNDGVAYRTEIQQAERAQCFTCFKESYLKENKVPWPYSFYPGCCEICGSDQKVERVKNDVLCAICKEKNT